MSRLSKEFKQAINGAIKEHAAELALVTQDPLQCTIDAMFDERMFDEILAETELSDESYAMWESIKACRCCGSTKRHGIPAHWTACGGCGSERF